MTEAKAGTKRRTRGGGIVLAGLREARYDAGITLERLSAKTEEGGDKVFASTINELENLKRGAQARTARALADALGVSIRELRQGERQRERPRLEGTPAADAVSEGRGE